MQEWISSPENLKKPRALRVWLPLTNPFQNLKQADDESRPGGFTCSSVLHNSSFLFEIDCNAINCIGHKKLNFSAIQTLRKNETDQIRIELLVTIRYQRLTNS